MVRRLSVTVAESLQCPLFEVGDRMTFDLPEVVAEDSSAVCAIAVADVLQATLKVAAGARPGLAPISCRGCRGGRALARWTVAVDHVQVDEATREALMPILSRIPLFQGLSQRRLEKVLAVVEIKSYQIDDILLDHGATNQPLYIVVDGTVEILTPDEEGALNRITSLGTGECVGEMSLLTGDPCSATIRCEGPVRALRITKANFDRLLEENPTLNSFFSRLLAQRLKSTSSQLLDDLKKDHDISGDLSMLSCAEILQAINATNRTGRLTIDGPKTLVLVFDQGRVIRMDTDAHPPEEGFFEAMTWRRGQFSFKVIDPGDVERNVYLDTMALLLEGMRRTDESAEHAVDDFFG